MKNFHKQSVAMKTIASASRQRIVARQAADEERQPFINVIKRSAISTGQLNTSPCVHLPPIEQLVLLRPSAYRSKHRSLISRKASRLDAFSGYPFRA